MKSSHWKNKFSYSIFTSMYLNYVDDGHDTTCPQPLSVKLSCVSAIGHDTSFCWTLQASSSTFFFFNLPCLLIKKNTQLANQKVRLNCKICNCMSSTLEWTIVNDTKCTILIICQQCLMSFYQFPCYFKLVKLSEEQQ